MNTIHEIVRGIKALTVVGAIAILGLCVMDYDSQIVDAAPGHSKPAEPVVDSKVLAKATEGRHCSPEPVLTDTIVVINLETGKTEIKGFDATYAAAKAGTVRVVTYCK